MCHALNEKWEKRISEGTELQNQEFIRPFEEKKNLKYLWMSEADFVKQAEMTEAIRTKYIRRKWKNTTAEISSKR